MQQILARLARPAAHAFALARAPGPGWAALAGAPVRLAARPAFCAPIRLLSSEALAHERRDDAAPSAPAASAEYVPVSYSEYTGISPYTMKAIDKVMGFKTATKVQDQIISRLPIEGDIMIKAKTGTGKTVAFLVSAIESLLRAYEADPERRAKGHKIGCLIVTPTRELAKQIATEAEKLVKHHRWGVQSIVGGERASYQLRALQMRRADIVIGTPGRLRDFLENQPSVNEQAVDTKVMIMDEADVLLDMGFRDELNKITSFLPADRQTFLVSATLNQKVRELASTVFARGFDMIDCVGRDEANSHANVKQEYITASPEQHIPLLIDLVETHIKQNKAEGRGSKIVVFFPTIKAADLYGEVLRQVVQKNVHQLDDRGFGQQHQHQHQRRGQPLRLRHAREIGDIVKLFTIHGKISQESRSRRSDQFRAFPVSAGRASILATTDVSARGVDYPDVSMVIQVGIPPQAESYIHRLGRTGRAGKAGEGVAILAPVEMAFLGKIKSMPITQSEKYTPDYIRSVCDLENGALAHLAPRITSAAQNADPERVESAYHSMLAYYAAGSELIDHPGGDRIIAGTEPMLKFFNVPATPIPRRLHEALRVGKLPRRDSSDRGSGSRGGGFGSRNHRGFGSRGGGSRSRDGGFGSRDDRFRSRDDRFGSRDDRFGSRDGGFGSRDRSFGSRESSFRDGSDRSQRGDRQSGGGHHRPTPHWMGRGKVGSR
ncbi:hypothetical protein H4R18_003198 [Coemansia javaensis]|uniref:ATP-dependent RNA helicase n=1 Tax=Coemansia javaensis TaxID=2761396 RepID=A0A9W8LIZ8_9FUNG|nr:hypothetical protein H4R18_003198 [Coemansia javaensis]